MRKFFLLSLVFLWAITLFAQTVIDDFEGYASSADVTAAWNITSWPTVELVENGGADGTAQYVQILDGGWSSGIYREYTGVVPEDGFYKVTFYYQNGHVEGREPVANYQFRVKFGEQQVKFDVPQETTTDWVAAETPVIDLTGITDLEIELHANHPGSVDIAYAVDEIYLEAVEEVEIGGVVSPLDGYIVSDIQTIAVTPTGGSGTFTSVDFDIGNNDTIDHTDADGPDVFTYDWDTTEVDDGEIEIKVIITDDLDNTGELIVTYTVSNALGGRMEYIVNGDFEDWTGDYPEEWTLLNANADGDINPDVDVTVIKETEDVIKGSNALKISVSTNPDPYRYTMLSNSFPGDRADYILHYWGKGAWARMYYFESHDDGTTWVSTWHGAFAGTAVWTEVMDAPYNPQVPLLAVATHVFSPGDNLFDNVSVTASTESDIPTHASSWDLFY